MPRIRSINPSLRDDLQPVALFMALQSSDGQRVPVRPDLLSFFVQITSARLDRLRTPRSRSVHTSTRKTSPLPTSL